MKRIKANKDGEFSKSLCLESLRKSLVGVGAFDRTGDQRSSGEGLPSQVITLSVHFLNSCEQARLGVL